MSKRKTNEEFEKELKEKQPDLELLSKYEGSKSKITCRCIIHDYIFTKGIYGVIYNGCPKCNGNIRIRNITSQEYEKKLNDVHKGNIVMIGDFVNMNTKILHRCNKHNLEWEVTPYGVLKSSGCKFCGIEKCAKSRKLTSEQYKQDIFEKVGNEFELISEYNGVHEDVTIRHNVESPHTFSINAGVFKSNPHCPACSDRNRIIIPGVNDFHTFYPELSIYFNNYEDGYNFSKSGKKQRAELRCPDCGHVFMGDIDSLITNGFSCPCCSDGISYPNKFIYNSLLQVKNNFKVLKREYYPSWCVYDYNGEKKRGYYDVYFELKNGKKYIIEMDGAIGHGDNTSSWSKDNALEIDRIKDILAKENNIEVIRIDCRYGSNDKFNYIVNNIKESSLKDIINLDEIDFNKSNNLSLTSYMKKACELWESGLSRKEISNALGLNANTITNYLSNGEKYGMCSYTKEEAWKRSCCKQVICLNTLEVFDSATKAANKYNTYKQTILKSCKNQKFSAGKSKTGEKLRWMFYKNYVELNKEDCKEELVL